MFKRFLEYALMGAGTCVGYFAVKKCMVGNIFNKFII